MAATYLNLVAPFSFFISNVSFPSRLLRYISESQTTGKDFKKLANAV
jgi:hypothetical protein